MSLGVSWDGSPKEDPSIMPIVETLSLNCQCAAIFAETLNVSNLWDKAKVESV